jgi:GGDEF domain-containing protein
MLIFDRIRLQDLDRRNMQLWVLAIVMILVLACGLALHMYTLASGTAWSLSRRAMLQGIIGFGALALLFVGYLIDRQMVIARLRKELEDEKKLNRARRTRGNKELLQSMFGPSQFSDRLALELQRASQSQMPLSGLTISLEVSPDLAGSEEIYSAFGEAVKAMMNRLRGEDSIYQFTSGVFGILLPGTMAETARGVAVRVADALNDAMGISKRYSFDIHITNFPNQATTAPQMEKVMRAPGAR